MDKQNFILNESEEVVINQELFLSFINNKDKRKNSIEAFTEYLEIFNLNRGSNSGHQSYMGGLRDHVLLVTLICVNYLMNTPLSLRFMYNLDDLIIATTFHDHDKLGKYESNRIFDDHLDVINWLDDHDLNNKNVRDGILHSHGGWSLSTEQHGPHGILLHLGDMFASNIFRTKEETNKIITMLGKELSDFIESSLI